MAARSQPYRLEWPMNPLQMEQLDEMLQILFDDLRNGNITISTLQVTGTVGVDQGGTGLTSYTIGDILYASNSSILARLGIGSANQVLQVNAGATAPEWGLVAFDNMTPAASASTLIGRRSGSAGNWEAITLGANLSMSAGGELSATGGGGGVAVGDGYWSPVMSGRSSTGDPADSEIVLDADGDAVVTWIET